MAIEDPCHGILCCDTI